MTKISKHIAFITYTLGALLPNISLAQIIITEVAWMGNLDSANYEWIELTNNGTSTRDISGWQLLAADGSPTIALDGLIASGQSVVLERTSDISAPGSAFIIYSGALGNTGELLTLKDTGNQTIDIFDASSGWPAGDNLSKETAQWNGTVWITATPTPGSYSGPIEKEETKTPDISTDTNITTTQDTVQPVAIINKTPLVFEIKIPEQIAAGQEFVLSPELSKGMQPLEYGNVQINFGDGTFYNSERKISTLKHTYDHPGTYLISYELRSDPWSNTVITSDSSAIEVIKPAIRIEFTDGRIRLSQEETEFLLDISGWIIQINEEARILPPLSFLGSNQFSLETEYKPEIIRLYDKNKRLQAEYSNHEDVARPILTEAIAPSLKMVVPNQRIPEEPKATSTINTEITLDPSLLAQVSSAPFQSDFDSNKLPWWNWLLPVLILIGLGLTGYLYWSPYFQDRSNQPRLFE